MQSTQNWSHKQGQEMSKGEDEAEELGTDKKGREYRDVAAPD